MIATLIFIHLFLGVCAIALGVRTTSDLIRKSVAASRILWFLRFSLGSSLAVLFIDFHHLCSAQKVAIAAVYAVGVVVLAWRFFHLQGKWRETFAFAIVLVVYLNILALSLQMPVPNAVGMKSMQVLLFVVALLFGAVTARKIAVQAHPAVKNVMFRSAAHR